MELKINDTYKIVTDKYNFILQKYEKVNKRNSDEVEYKFKDVGYFPSLHMALHRFLKEKIRDLDTTDFQTIINTISQVKREITEATKHIKNDYTPGKNDNREVDEDDGE